MDRENSDGDDGDLFLSCGAVIDRVRGCAFAFALRDGDPRKAPDARR